MPLKVRRLWLSCLILTAAGAPSAVVAQQQAENQPSAVAISPAIATPTAITIQQRISKVRALIAARNFAGAANELEKLKKENFDESVQQVSRVMLMGVYLEQPDYARAQTLLEESFKRKALTKGAFDSYYAVAGQIIKGSQSQLERYKRLGINLADAGLPNEACTDLGKWQSLLELVVEQSKKMTVEMKQPDEALSLLEAASSARSTLARDEYEAAKWKNEVNDTRELISNAQMKVKEVDASMAIPAGTLVASNPPSPTVFKQIEAPKIVSPIPADNKAVEQQIAGGQSEILNPISPTVTAPAPTTQPKTENAVVEKKPEPTNNVPANNTAENLTRQRVIPKTDAPETAKKETAPANAGNGTMQVGSLVEMATKKVNPFYPAFARTARVSGIVKVEVLIGEDGKVAEVRTAAGPEMLRRAAMEAVKRWEFKPVTRDGQPVKATGFVNFNFTL